MIQRPEPLPQVLRDEITLHADEATQNGRAKETRLTELLKKLNPETSRAVVFVTSRRLAEELADQVHRETDLLAAPFHAGLSAEVRLETYERFRDGKLAVLCATKAFGMGMDIDNIHLIVHFGPPSSLEDYLQEVGRAARRPELLEEVGLKTAEAWLLYEPRDFSQMRDRLKKEFLSALDLMELHGLLVEEWKQAGSPSDGPINVEPSRLANRFRGGTANGSQVRLGLHWLEKLRRIEVGSYAPAQITVEIDERQAKAARPALSQEARNLLDYLIQHLDANTEQSTVVCVQVRHAAVSLGFATQDQLFVHLTELAHRQVIRYQRKLLLPLAERRAQESRAGLTTGEEWPLLNAALRALKELAEDPKLNADPYRLTCKQDDLRNRFAAIADEHLQPERFTWVDVERRDEEAQRERQGFPRYVPAVLRLLHGLHIVRIRQEVTSDGLVFHLSPGRRDRDRWLNALPALARRILRHIVQVQANEPSIGNDIGEVDAQELLLTAQDVARSHHISVSVSHLQAILRFLRHLGYLRRADTFVPMALEVQVTDPEPLTIGGTGRDAEVLDQFQEQKRLRILRLAALQAIPVLVGNREKLRQFVEQRYFQEIKSAQELMTLLEKTLPKDNEILRQLREEALKELLDGNPAEGKPGLSPQQRAVYDAPLDRHLMVVAGPGAGKTHILLARLVRLVHKEDVQANEILVLAFTRAVVSEVRYRLQDLLGRLGYGTLARAIRVTTFHSFVLRTLREFNLVQGSIRLDSVDWFEKFEEHLQSNPAMRHHVATRYRYVFVDEFQDVHGARYRLLEYLAAGRQTYLLVVGDDDQSIYEYERSEGEGGAPKYFERFQNTFDPLRFDLTLNYRSAKKIVDFSQDILAALPNRLKQGRLLEPYWPVQGVAEWRPSDSDLIALIREVEQRLHEIRDRRSQHNTIAILTRTNADVYRIKAQLQQELGKSFALLVQGEESRFIERRDVTEVMDRLRQSQQYEGRAELTELLRRQLSKKQFRYWLRDQPPEQHELWYLAEEFLAEAGHKATIADFVEYIREISDNGNYLRVVARRQAAKRGKGRILLSTIHKVKGIEFPAVILVSSDMKVDSPDQELRVMYVGMARAEDVLIALKGEREECLLQQRSFKPPELQHRGIAVAPNLSDVFVSKFGYEWTTQQTVFNKVRPGDAITIVRNRGRKNPFSIRHDPTGQRIGLLAGTKDRKDNLTRKLLRRFGDAKEFVGLEVTGIYRHYTEQDRQHDEQYNSHFYASLCPEVKARGYYYVVEIGGLVRPAQHKTVSTGVAHRRGNGQSAGQASR